MRHPAPFREDHIKGVLSLLDGLSVKSILDPFAGTGKVHELRNHGYITMGIEKEPEWADMSQFTVQGDCIEVMSQIANDWTGPIFDAVVTSPAFGNRMADKYVDHTRRHTYTAYLGRQIEGDSSAVMNWGKRYRDFHKKAWSLATRLASSYFILNIKDHIRAGKNQEVSKWHVETLANLGWNMKDAVSVDAPGIRHGENHALRTGTEYLFLFERS